MKKFFLVVAVVASFIMSGCATDGSRLAKLEQNETKINQFINEQGLQRKSPLTSFRFHGWTAIDERHFILDTGPSRRYLIKLTTLCSDLRFATAISFKQTAIGLSEKFDSIRPLPSGSYDCFIDQIYPISKEQQKTLLGQLKQAEEATESSDKS